MEMGLDSVLEGGQIKISTVDPVGNGPCVELLLHEDICFKIDGRDILKLGRNGEIYVRGILVENDVEVTGALRRWLEPVINRV